jgi:SAM-dependent methyltransferase
VKLADRVSLRSRERKLGLFLETMKPTPETTVLDAGVDDAAFGAEIGCATLNFFEEHYPWPERVTALGITPGDTFSEHYPGIRYVQGDACALPFADGEFDVLFSNAVIEHVGGRERQQAFADEALRVAARAFVTTPNRWFPVEVHTRLPLVHWLPERAAHRAYDLVRKPWAKENHLLGPRDLERLFRGRARIVNLGMTLVAIVG